MTIYNDQLDDLTQLYHQKKAFIKALEDRYRYRLKAIGNRDDELWRVRRFAERQLEDVYAEYQAAIRELTNERR